MSGRCADCRHWQTPMRRDTQITAVNWDEAAGRYVFTEKAHEYPEKMTYEGWRVCTRAGRDGALMEVGGHEDGPLETAPGFGCVMFEPLPLERKGE